MSSNLRMLLALFLAGTVFVACSSSGPSGQTTAPSPTGPPAQGGAQVPKYSEPVPLTEGDYWPEDLDVQDVVTRGEAGALADQKNASFEGILNGVRLYSFADSFSDSSVGKRFCVVKEFRETDKLSIAYVPRGTFANGPTYEGICEGGDISFIEREFTTKHGNFAVIFSFGEAAFGHDASTARVHEARFGSRAGIAIDPLTEEGFGRGWTAYATKQGVMIVDGQNLPLSELTGILEGVTCEDCS